MRHPTQTRLPAVPLPHTVVRRLNLSAALAGFGLAGLFDSLVLHRLLGWHHLLDLTLPGAPLDARIRHDAFLDTTMFIALVTGLIGAISCRKVIARINPRCIAGMVLAGFGGWHIADAVLVHWLLGLHRIRPEAQSPLLWDIGWLATFGLLPLLIGVTLRKTALSEDA